MPHPYLGIAVVAVVILLAIVDFAVVPAWRWARRHWRNKGR